MRSCFVTANVLNPLTAQDEEGGCWYLALWVLHEDGGWRRLDLQVGFFFTIELTLHDNVSEEAGA